MAAYGKGKGRPGRWLAALCGGLALAALSTTAADPARGKIRFGGDADYPPYHFIDARGRADGFDVELARAVAADLGMEPVFELGDWSAALERLARGEVDAVPMFWSATREQRFGLTEPILLRHHALFGHYETPTVSALDMLANARVAVQASGLAAEAMHELDRPGISLVEIDNEADTLAMVARGEVQYALVPTGIGYHAIQYDHLPGIVALSPPLLERKYVFGVKPGDPQLVTAINASLERLRRNGVQNALYVKWVGSPAMQEQDQDPGAAPAGLAALLAALATLAVAGLAFLAWRHRGLRQARAGHDGRGDGLAKAAEDAPPPLPAADDPRLLAELSQAIDEGRLDFAFQPKVDLRSGRLLGAELLVRWDHPRLGPIPPEAFVHAAEQAGTVGKMTLYLVRHGLAHCREWPATGDPLQVSVNVSANDLADPAMVDAIIEARGAGGPGLMLEITETEVMREPERVAEALPRLREQGIRISVDDFGAGHSSLVNLRRLAPDELKIDRSFVHAVMASHSDRAIVRATIQLGHELGASVAAEGIENEATRRWLLEAGCDSGQGFGIARPMPPGEFVELLRRQG